MKSIYRPICWWFGCVPDYESVYFDSLQDMWTEPPCKRCGAHWVAYSDMVGDSRQARFRDWLTRLTNRKQPVDFNDSVPF